MLWIEQAFQEFWRRHPALLYGSAMLLGVSSALSWNLIFFIPIIFLVIPILRGMRRRLLLATLVGCVAFIYTHGIFIFPKLPVEGVAGTAHLEISSVTSTTTHFGKRWQYKGTIQSFSSVPVKNIPYVLSIPKTDEATPPPATTAYIILGKLKESQSGRYTFSVVKDTPWYPVEGSWSSAEYRLWAKQWVSSYIQKHISDQRAATFLAGIATGDFDDRLMVFEFSRFGVQHIMAISGFHFAIISGILCVLLRFLLPKKYATGVLICLLSGYFVFLGSSPSIMRAWITSLIVLLGLFIERQGSGLNSLGVGLLAILMMDPLSSQNLGFQFSFATTAAILLFNGCSDEFIQKIFLKRSLSQVILMDGLNQHGYCVLVFFRQAFALTVAVNLIALPLTLYYFHKFPMMSLVHNLFFPFLVSISMLLLILGFLFGWIPLIGEMIHSVNNVYTQFVLNFTYNLPTSFDVVWRSTLSFEVLVVYLTLIFGLSICVKYYFMEKGKATQDWAFV